MNSLLESSISHDAEQHRRLEALGQMALHACASATAVHAQTPTSPFTAYHLARDAAPNSVGAQSTLIHKAARLSAMSPLPKKRASMTPSPAFTGVSHEIGLELRTEFRDMFVEGAVEADTCCERGDSRCYGFPAYGQNESELSFAVRDERFCRLSLTPRDTIRVGNVELRLKNGGEPKVQNLKHLEDRIKQLRQYNSALEDQLAGARAQAIALQSGAGAMRRSCPQCAQLVDGNLQHSQEVTEFKKIIEDLRQKLKESEDREKSRALSSAAHREEQLQTQLWLEQSLKEKEDALKSQAMKLEAMKLEVEDQQQCLRGERDKIKLEEEQQQQYLKAQEDKIKLEEAGLKREEAALAEKERQKSEQEKRNRAARAEQLMRRILFLIRHRKTARAFVTWLENAFEVRRRRKVASRSISRILNRVAAQALVHWQEMAGEERRRRGIATKCILRILNGVVAHALGRWQETTRRRVCNRARISSSVIRLTRQTEVQSLACWKDETTRLVRARQVLGRILRQMLNRMIGVVFRTWVDRAWRLKGAREVASQCVNRLCFGFLHVAWETWCDAVATEKEARKEKDNESKWTAKLRELEEAQVKMEEGEQHNVCSMRERIMQLETELESIRQILELRAGEEYLRLVKGYRKVDKDWATGTTATDTAPTGNHDVWTGMARKRKGKQKIKVLSADKKITNDSRTSDDRTDVKGLSLPGDLHARGIEEVRGRPKSAMSFERDALESGQAGIRFLVTQTKSGSPGRKGKSGGAGLMTATVFTTPERQSFRKSKNVGKSGQSLSSSKTHVSQQDLFNSPDKSGLLLREYSTFFLSPDFTPKFQSLQTSKPIPKSPDTASDT